jgi:hypothetical protein
MEKKESILQFALGLTCALAGALIMVNGSIFGDNNTDIATVVGFVGICLISTSPVGLLKNQMK